MTDMSFVYGLLSGGIGVFIIIAIIGTYMYLNEGRKAKNSVHKESENHEKEHNEEGVSEEV